MGHESLPRAYRLKAGRMWYLVVLASGPFLGALLALATGRTRLIWLELLLWALFLGCVGWLGYALRRGGTFADAQGIEIRGYIRRTRFAWAEIQDIRARPNPAAARNRMAPAHFVDIHGHNGQRNQLPWVDSAHVDVAREVAALRAIWERNRTTPAT
ncbi:PH domain-containing protein [Kitasatospora sp. Root187]|uniref:PH domain-containing protein n=1 Tax=Kitasatospora sp. Root187 TaxID=1736486 RepID=UPI000B0DC3AE|nr:PH domain-containing protein [Kitasatospora sp. Root187]